MPCGCGLLRVTKEHSRIYYVVITVITPVYKESIASLSNVIEQLLTYRKITQIIISLTRTDPGYREIEDLWSVKFNSDHRLRFVIVNTAGRSAQMNAAAQKAESEILLFLHADSQLPTDADNGIIHALSKKHWGRFDLGFDDGRFIYKIIAWFINKRSRLTGISTGDQAIFVTRKLFERIGGFPEQALMEDIEFCKIAKQISKPYYIDQKVITSARRWQSKGIIRTIILMWWLRGLYWLGMPSDRLANWYKNAR